MWLLSGGLKRLCRCEVLRDRGRGMIGCGIFHLRGRPRDSPRGLVSPSNGVGANLRV